jgi:hypothetical protein
MRVKKSVTEAVRRANRENGKKTQGPNDTSRTRDNATQHGLLGGKIEFKNDEQAKEFDNMLAAVIAESGAEGLLEQIEVEIMAHSLYHLPRIYAAEFAENSRQNQSSAQVDAMRETGVERGALIRAATQDGCQVESLIFRAGPSGRSEDEDDLDELAGGMRHVVVSTKLANRLDLMHRYGTRYLRQYHGALAVLRALQRERAEREQLQSLNGDTGVENEEE